MANTVVKGSYVKYNSGVDRFSNRVVDNIDGSDLSPIDNLISPLRKEMLFKNGDVESKVVVDFINVDNGWYFAANDVIMSISKINK